MSVKLLKYPFLYILGLLVLVACGSAEPTTTPEPPIEEQPVAEATVAFVVPNPTPMPLPTGSATEVTAQVLGSSVIYLAGRSDLQIPPAGELLPEGFDSSCRGVILETRPVGWQIAPDSTFTFQATGEIDFFGGMYPETTRPDGKADLFSGVVSLGGISPYEGPQASLIGLFLDDQPPTGSAPAALKYQGEEATLSVSDASYSPALGQLFFIGDGLTGVETGETQTFIAPAGATRLYLGFADGYDFVGAPGCYGDNSGAFMVKVTGSQPFSPLP